MRDLYKLWSAALTTEQMDTISAAARQQPEEKATIFSAAEGVDQIRLCSVQWLADEWIQDLLWSYVSEANANSFKCDVSNRAEMQISTYRGTEGGHYHWHHDVQWNGHSDWDRKLSVTVQLSHSDEYEGGDFEFDELKTNADFRSRGTVLVFPSYLRHRIQPVTAGTRCALVAWFFGPRWK